MAGERPIGRLLMRHDLWTDLAQERVRRQTRRVAGNTPGVGHSASR
jgi:hypothetical protein